MKNRRRCNLAVIAQVERLLADSSPGLPSRLRGVLAAARDGQVASSPRELSAYLAGALHALQIPDDLFFRAQDALAGLRPGSSRR